MRRLTRVGISAGFAAAVSSVFAPSLGATSVYEFNQMKDGADEAYVQVMAKVAQKVLVDAGKPDVALKVHALFTDVVPQKDQPDMSLGMYEFIVAADAFTKDEVLRDVSGETSKDGPFRIEEMMVRELRTHRITLPPTFMAIAKAGKMKTTAAMLTR
jgi:hypothetical protein